MWSSVRSTLIPACARPRPKHGTSSMSWGCAKSVRPSPPLLPLPERKRREVARALATGPRVIMLDEVMAGLRPTETDHMVALFRALNASMGLTILLIEHVMRAVMALSSGLIVLNHGRLIAAGPPAEVTRDPAVLECYLGEEAI